MVTIDRKFSDFMHVCEVIIEETSVETYMLKPVNCIKMAHNIVSAIVKADTPGSLNSL